MSETNVSEKKSTATMLRLPTECSYRELELNFYNNNDKPRSSSNCEQTAGDTNCKCIHVDLRARKKKKRNTTKRRYEKIWNRVQDTIGNMKQQQNNWHNKAILYTVTRQVAR